MALLQLLVLLAAIMRAQQVEADQQDNRTSLHLLNILDFPDSREEADMIDSAYLLIPAAQLAVDQINNASHILPGYKLTLVNVEAEACSDRVVAKGIANTYAKLFTPGNSLNVVGFTGLFCSTVTDTITLIYGVPNMTYLQFAGSITPLHRDSIKFPWLVHFRSSTATFNDAMVEVMKKFNWATVSVVFQFGDFFFETIADDLVRNARDTDEFNVTAKIPIFDNTESIFVQLNSRIVYITASDEATVELMCKAYRSKALYPRFVYIFPAITVPALLSLANISDCSRKELEEAMEGVLTMAFRLSNEGDHKLISNMTYQEYRHQYLQYLMEMELATNTTLSKDNIFSNVMYDQIWAFALTLGNSLVNLQAANISLEKLQLQQTNQFASILRSKLENLSFEGASASLHLNEDGDETSLVEIFQQINSTIKLVGVYNPDDGGKLDLLRELSLPPDTFETKTIHLPSWVSAFFNIYVIFWIFVTTFVVIFLCSLKRRPEVKASSPFLSLAMIIGCYLAFTSILFRNITAGYLIANLHIFALFCNTELWFGIIGLTLIFSALLMRLLRVSRIFKAYAKLSKFWKDKYMILSILAICFGEILLLTLWSAVDTIHIETTITYQPHAIPHFFERSSVCSDNALGFWLVLALSYNFVLMLVVAIVAVRTRKIRLSNFKNTKQVNILITVTFMSLGFLVPVSLFPTIDGTFVHFIVCFAYSCPGVYCHIFIFLPQIFNTVVNMKAEKKGTDRGTTLIPVRESQFSLAVRQKK